MHRDARTRGCPMIIGFPAPERLPAPSDEKRIGDYLRDFVLREEHRSRAGFVQVAVHPGESLACRAFAWWRELTAGQTAVQVPGDEHPAVFGIDVREPAVGVHCGSNQKPETPMSFDE